jgi:hypothetical protein
MGLNVMMNPRQAKEALAKVSEEKRKHGVKPKSVE